MEGSVSRKHNTKHNRGQSSYGQKVAEGGASRQSDVMLSDGKRASAKR